ncbi:hypothetical protein QFZ42_005401 [Variovorax paradoxus]|uniref:hypothetical protein n=1 Tax=Variovorax paradoxus TaxID=34073 RepID=UPI002793B15F|nr:hypothetical protein [Variovorax paradoxus]MDQ0573567.1 hypothetical protein [Variovorax paradoxus]
MSARPRIARAAGAASAALLLLLMGGCSHYHIGIPLVPGLSIGLGATKDGNFSVGLNTGWGPLGAGVAVNNSGVVAGSAGVGVGAGVGPIGTGVGVSKSVVLHDPNAAKTAYAPAGGAAPVTSAAVASAAPVVVTKDGATRPMLAPVPLQPPAAARVSYRPAAVAQAGELGTPANPIAP